MSAGIALPHQDLDAEAAVIATCLLDPAAADEVTVLLTSGEFYAHANQRVFAAIEDCVDERIPPDVLAVANRLRTKGQFESIGGSSYLAQLADATPAIANVRHHCKIITTLARLRKAGEALGRLAVEVRGAVPDADAFLDRVEAEIYNATRKARDEAEGVTYGEVMGEVWAEISAAARGEVAQGMKTGFFMLDRHTGGLHPGELTYVGGRPGAGKTSFVVQVAEEVASQGVAVFVYSLEMKRKQLGMRTISRRAEIPFGQVRAGRMDEAQWKRCADVVRYVDALPLIIDDVPGLSPRKLRSRIRRDHAKLERKHGKRFTRKLVVIDYVQLMVADNPGDQNRTQQLGDISHELKEITMEFDCPVVALSSLSRAVKGQKVKPPELTDLRDSGDLEFDADNVIMIHRDDQYRERNEQRDGLADILVRKGRNVGEAHCISRFEGKYTAFYDIDAGRQQEDLYQ